MAISLNDSVSEAAAKTFKLIVEGAGFGETLDVLPQAARNNVQSMTNTKKARSAYLISTSLKRK